MKRRRLLSGVLVLVVTAALAAAHVVYWYRPRPRPARPAADSPVAALLADERYPVVAWLPYPHQNLGMLRLGERDHQAYLAAIARLAGLPPPKLPAFGSFTVAPAYELALACDETCDRFLVVARVYPLLAAFARLAGRVADNTWLRGGTVSLGGRPAEVAWDGDLWVVRDAASPPFAPRRGERDASVSEPERVLALLSVRYAADPFPAGRYRLRASAAGLEAVGDRPLAPALWRAVAGVDSADLALAAMRGGDTLGASPRALAFFAHDDPASTDLPRAAAFHRAGGADQGWELPGVELLRLAGEAPRRADQAGWTIQALDNASLIAARPLADQLAAAAIDDTLAWGLWARLDASRREVERIAAMVEAVPLVPRREAARWQDAAFVLGPIARRYRRVTAVVTQAPRAFRLVLEAEPPAEEASTSTPDGRRPDR